MARRVSLDAKERGEGITSFYAAADQAKLGANRTRAAELEAQPVDDGRNLKRGKKKGGEADGSGVFLTYRELRNLLVAALNPSDASAKPLLGDVLFDPSALRNAKVGQLRGLKDMKARYQGQGPLDGGAITDEEARQLVLRLVGIYTVIMARVVQYMERIVIATSIVAS